MITTQGFVSDSSLRNNKTLSTPKERASENDIKAYHNSSHGKDGEEAFTFLESIQKNQEVALINKNEKSHE